MTLSDFQFAIAPSLQIHPPFDLSLPQSVSVPYDSLDVEYQFNELRNKWRSEYGSASSARAIVSAPSYKRLIFMGNRVLPLIFRDLDESAEPDYWFAALKEITKADPVSQSDRGNMRVMARIWIKWAKAHGYTW